ncbi:MAG: RES family NAD+ phosphorylase [Bacteroidia bacterium]|nr:RES family NAD+ phosphorylase [Bacteroidia bacterium]
MNVFRLCKSVYSNDLSGKGAALFGGRWNSKGVPVIYTSESRSLCFLEAAVHFPLGNSPVDFTLVTISVPDAVSILVVEKTYLQEGWNAAPFHLATREIGDNLLKEMEYPVIKVPSALVPGDYNFLINPLHPEANKITIHSTEPFPIDQRLAIRD